MTLSTIANPGDLREMTNSELSALCSEIRSFLIQRADGAKAGFHLGSNLGAVELTVALHRVLRSPEDVLLWDTGHQAYVHKLLTGRMSAFDGLRQSGGLSGYPSAKESFHDRIENSHASTALSYAYGFAAAHKQSGRTQNRRVTAVVGDGAATGGMAFEALNNIGFSQSDVTIVLNDNGRSYAPTVSHWIQQRQNGEAKGHQMAESFCQPFGIEYRGPLDGHDIAGLEEALREANSVTGPVLLHVVTTKGKGFPLAEADQVKKMHDTNGKFLPASNGGELAGAKSSAASSTGSYTKAFSDALVKLGADNNEVVAITAAMPDSTGLLPFGEAFPGRVYDVGIAEQHAVTAAAGMAMGGLRPVVAVYSTFLSRAFDQANLDVGLHRQPVIFCIDRAGITGPDGPSHHGTLDMVLMSKIPGMTIFAPSSFEEVGRMLHDAFHLVPDGPVCIRWPRTPARHVPSHEVGHGLSARMAREGGDTCIIGIGKMLDVALEAADELAALGINPTVWDPRVVKPLDPEMISSLKTARHIVTIEDGLVDGGIGEALARELGASSAIVDTLGIPTQYVEHGDPSTLLASLALDPSAIVKAVKARH